ncbi:MAG: hypothetical protein HN712_19390 [Gemmatimonadetes bacterium]|jgi:hypothetical protein|nr:hypothetical protein [Gemmatimonadota bacterium]MBT7862489.1 hypothetical protein [Gemmatimonadota bacterium]
MRKTIVLGTALVAVLLAGISAPAVAFENCNGIGYFALQVPNPGSMNPDGNAADWAWFDPDFIVGNDQLCDVVGSGEFPSRADLDIAHHVAWSPEPDNRLYVFTRVVDDTLNNDVTEPNDGWNDDDLELILDPDHGVWNEAPDALRTGHQQWTFHYARPGGYAIASFLRWNQPAEMQWGVEQGAVEGVVVASPAGATHLSTDVTLNYEVRMEAFDPYMPDGRDASVQWNFQAGQTIGMSLSLNEADGEGRTHQVTTHVDNGGAHSSEFTSEFTLLSSGEFATAVEASSWGAVKALMR